MQMTIYEIIDCAASLILAWENPRNPKPGKVYSQLPPHMQEKCKMLKSDDIKDIAPYKIRRLIGGS